MVIYKWLEVKLWEVSEQQGWDSHLVRRGINAICLSYAKHHCGAAGRIQYISVAPQNVSSHRIEIVPCCFGQAAAATDHSGDRGNQTQVGIDVRPGH